METPTKREFQRAMLERHIRSNIRELIGHQLRNHYQACTTEELPPRLLALVKKMDPETPEY